MLNPYAQSAKQYQKQQVETASPEELLLLMYDGAIRFLNVARKSMEEKNIEKSHNNLIRAQHIVTELMASLDMEIGGEVAQNLFRLYDYLHYRLVQANIKKDTAMIDEVLTHLRSLKETWEQAIKIAHQERQQAPDVEAKQYSA
ncbi:MAG: flagellar export chaperone FliS [Cyanobacteria bacterium]|nr:flagellar export chaperone FliS [Cyanobacteriota bacterium]